jgi:hypothetical protein
MAHDQAISCISATGTSREQRVSSFHCISNPRSLKCRKGPGQRRSHIHSSVDLGHPSNGTRGARSSHFGISATGTSREQRVSSFRCISNPRNARNAESAFEDRHRVTARGHLGVIERTVQRAEAPGLAAEGITAFSRDQFSSTSILVLAKNK